MTFLSFPVHLDARMSFYNYLSAISKSTAEAMPRELPASAFDLVILAATSMLGSKIIRTVQGTTWQQVGEEVFRPARWIVNVQAVWPSSCHRREKQENLAQSRIRRRRHRRFYSAYGDTARTRYLLEIAARRGAKFRRIVRHPIDSASTLYAVQTQLASCTICIECTTCCARGFSSCVS